VTRVPKTGEYNSCLAKWNIQRRFSLCANSGFHFGNYFLEKTVASVLLGQHSSVITE
jgi:hypothetical protein